MVNHKKLWQQVKKLKIDYRHEKFREIITIKKEVQCFLELRSMYTNLFCFYIPAKKRIWK